MSDLTLGPFTVGIDNVSPETTLPQGAVRDAVNVDFDRSGGIATRAGYTQVVSEAGMHSLWRSPKLGVTFCVKAGYVCSLTMSGSTLSSLPLYRLSSTRRVSFDDLNDGVVFTDGTDIAVIGPDGVAQKLGIEDPGAPTAAVVSGTGSAQTGSAAEPVTRGVAISYLRGNEESGLSPAVFCSGPVGSMIDVTLPQPMAADVTKICIYATQPNGDIMFKTTVAPVGISTWRIGSDVSGRAATNQFLRRMVAGDIVRYWRGRLLVARGPVLYFSDPIRYGLYDPRTNFTPFAHDIVMLESLEASIFVGTQGEGVYHISGDRPGEFRLRKTSGGPVSPWTSTRVAAGELGSLGENLGLRAETYALWFARNGFVIGTDEGRLVEVQRDRFRLPTEQWSAAGSLVVANRQAIAVLN